MVKLVFKEYLTPNVMQITLINQIPYMETCSETLCLQMLKFFTIWEKSHII